MIRHIVSSVLLVVLVAGCGYTLRPPFDPSVKTVYVPVFKSVNFRRDLNLQLTELVQKEIGRRSTFRLASEEHADTILEGTIVFADKNLMVENPNNLPRELLEMLTVEVRWIDNRSAEARERGRSAPPVRVVENMPFFPEIGETTNLAFQRGLERIARDIVNMMETPW